MDDAEALDHASVFAVCGQASIFGSIIAFPLTLVMVFILEPPGWGWPSILDVVAFVMYGVIFLFAATIVSAPFVLILAFPLTLVVSRYLRRSIWRNTVLGGVIGAVAGYVAPLSFIMPPGLITAVYAVPYGAFTGFFVTRMRYG